MNNPEQQELAIYWDDDFAALLDTWGEKTVWKEIPLLLAACRGRVLDIACGTGKVIEILARTAPRLEVHGCDISDKLIGQAIARGIPADRLKVCDATDSGYADGEFDYGYSIGSLEHFTEEGIVKTIKECYRTVKGVSFHLVPVSKSGRDEGWVITKPQSYFNNSVQWWLDKFRSAYETVYVVDSAWECPTQAGKWFVCLKRTAKTD